MREIKFRAWGHLPECDDYRMFFDIYLFPFKGSLMPANGEFTNPMCDHTLMQYTGLKDKNGVEIYEGDLVLVREVRICEVIFHELAGCWDLILRNTISSESIGSVSPSSYTYHAEVIGNIHQHPELLEADNG